ncbi:MAG: F0F1 ATP synthase subunit B [Bacteroidetes bacterium]|nr:F0F1 ATP synthase subunit B [Bacteroidota bacterium]
MDIITPAFGLVFWMVISFGIVLLILGKYAWKPILKVLKEREQSITDALEKAERAKEKLALLKTENEKLINLAKEERDMILRKAKETANEIIAEAREKSKAEGEKIRKNTIEAIRNERQAAIFELKNQVASLSIEISEKILRSELSDPSKQKSLIDNLVREAQLN